jgi:multisubunit Na+/H+ antiporter MnhB subunit
MFMTVVSVSYVLFARRPEGFGLNWWVAVGAGLAVAAFLLALFARAKRRGFAER